MSDSSSEDGGVQDEAERAARAAAAAAAAGAAGAADVVSTSTTNVPAAGTTAGIPTGGASAGGSGIGGSGSGGGWFGDDDDDDEKLFADIPWSGRIQVLALGLLTAGLLLFGPTVWGWFFDGESPDVAQREIVLASDDADIDLNDDPFASTDFAAAGAAAAAVVAVEEPATTTTAAPATTTTAAPTTTTTVAETTTTAEATTTTVAVAFTMWDALVGSGEADQFATVGSALGLQADLEALEDADGNPVNRTLFALSDDAMAQLDLAALVADPDGATALVGYHFVDERLLAEDLAALDGEQILTRTGLPLSISVVDGQITLNGNSVVLSSDIQADNGVIHIITPALDPPTINEVIDLENIEFEVNSDVITAAGQQELQKAVAFFTENPTVSARIEGHTDTDGSDDLNQDLSDRRAASVKAFLVENGVNGDNLQTIGFGETQPILVDGVEDKEQSRRIEFNVR